MEKEQVQSVSSNGVQLGSIENIIEGQNENQGGMAISPDVEIKGPITRAQSKEKEGEGKTSNKIILYTSIAIAIVGALLIIWWFIKRKRK